MKERLELLLSFEGWANERAIESLVRANDYTPAVRLFAHILAAQQAWLMRLTGQDSTGFQIWPAAGMDECRKLRPRLQAELEEWLDGTSQADLEHEISYRNQAGREFRNTPLDILTHLTLHSQHHRGQIALELREIGVQPAVTDFIAFRREQLDQG